VTVKHGGLKSNPGSWFGYMVPGTGTGDFASHIGSEGVGGHLDLPAGGHEEDAMAITERDPIR
jgi:hypothetical protein